jgi:hypothetical protein
MAEAQTGTGGEVRPSTPDRQAGGLTAGQKHAEEEETILKAVRRLGTLDPVRVWRKVDN